MLGIAFKPNSDVLLIVDSGATPDVVLQVDTGTFLPASVFMTLPPGTVADAAKLNAITFDNRGQNVYVSDSVNGIIWTTPSATGGEATVWSNGAAADGTPLLGPGTGLDPPFGANGIAFSNLGNILYVANTAFSSDRPDPGEGRRHR
jgi:hypothetical protein